MSVQNSTFRLNIRQLRVPGVDTRLPTGVWFGQAQVTGDASGGTATLIIQIPHDGPVSVEGAAPGAAAGASDDNVLINWLTRNSIGEAQTFAIGGLMQITGNPSGALSPMMRDQQNYRLWPISYGLESGDVTPPETNVIFVNQDTIVYTSNFWGYLWDRRSLVLPGGPLRPDDGGQIQNLIR